MLTTFLTSACLPFAGLVLLIALPAPAAALLYLLLALAWWRWLGRHVS